MRKLFYLIIVAVILPTLVLTSCRETDPNPDTKTEFELLTEYMAANDLDLSDVLMGASGDNKWVKPKHKIGYVEADGTVPDYYIMDIRKAADFSGIEPGKGHIKGAHNVAFANILTEAPANKNDKILVVCYTGQTAARAVGLLRMSGYKNAYSLKWGMSCWAAEFDKWSSNTSGAGHANWVDTDNDWTAVAEFDAPTLSTGATTGEAIFNARIQAALTDSNWLKANDEVLANPGNYFINSKWSADAWNTYGHIDGAYRIDTPDLSLAKINNLNPAEDMITYCYTGQTSSITTAWLNVLGFDDAQSLKFGVNAIVYDDLLAGAPGVSWLGTGSGSDLPDYIFEQ